MLGENAGVNVGGPAGAERHDDPDRTRRVVLRLQGCGPRQYRRKRESERNQRNAARQYDHANSSVVLMAIQAATIDKRSGPFNEASRRSIVYS
jgi:hypothetical protein